MKEGELRSTSGKKTAAYVSSIVEQLEPMKSLGPSMPLN